MQLVDVIEAEIGAPVEAWPSSILTLLFVFDPHMPYALTNLQTIIAFFYGNNVPLNLACQFFVACSFYPLHLVKHQFTYLYNLWSQYPPSPSRFQYDDLEKGPFTYTDGTYATAFDDVIPDFGYEYTGFPSLARRILLQVNQQEFVEDDEE